MTELNRPRLTNEQIDELKSDIKFLSNAIYKAVSGHNVNKIGTTTSQNAIAREFNYKSFSELSLHKVPTEHNPDFSLASALTIQQFYNAYRDIKTAGGGSLRNSLTVTAIASALTKLEQSKLVIEETFIGLQDLYEIINADEYHYGHTYQTGDGYPSEFTVSAKAKFFEKLRSWDHFRVYDGKDYKCFTVEQFEHIYDKKPCFKVVVGRRYESGFSVGDQ